MRVALLMSPMRYRNQTNWFEALHHLSKGEPQFVRFASPLRRWGVLDFRAYPLGLIWLATVIKDRHTPRIFNFLEGGVELEEIRRFSPDVIGFSCSTGSNLIWIDEVARRLKKECRATIVMGGPHVTLDPAATLESTVADFVVAGEGEEVFPQLIDHIAGCSPSLPREGIWRRNHGQVVAAPPAVVKDLALLPEPDHGLVDQRRYPGVHLETSRGCFFCCDFCYLSGFGEAASYRARPVEAIVRELAQVARLRDLTQTKVYLVDNNFRNNRRIGELMAAFQAAGLRASFWTATDTHLDDGAIRRMRDGGFHFIHCGVESGTPERYAKVPSREHVLSFYRRAREMGLKVGADFVLLAPGQRPSDLRRATSFAWTLARTRALGRVIADRRDTRIMFQPHLYRPFPGTAAAAALRRAGVKLPRTLAGWGWLHDGISRGEADFTSFGQGITRRDLSRAMIEFFLLNLTHQFFPLLLRQLRAAIARRLPCRLKAARSPFVFRHRERRVSGGVAEVSAVSDFSQSLARLVHRCLRQRLPV